IYPYVSVEVPKLNSVELRKLQMTGGASYTVSLPKDWVKEQGLKVGDIVAIMPRSDSSLTLIPHEKIPTGKNRGAEVTVSPSKEQDKEQILRTILAQYLAGYDIIRVRFPITTRPDLRTYLREAARKMFVGSEIIEESRDELIVQCLSSYGDLPAPKVISRMSLIAKLMLRDAEDSLKALAKSDGILANKSIASAESVEREAENVMDKLFTFKLSPKSTVAVRLVLESLKRISEYSEDVAEMAINLTARRTELY